MEEFKFYFKADPRIKKGTAEAYITNHRSNSPMNVRFALEGTDSESIFEVCGQKLKEQGDDRDFRLIQINLHPDDYADAVSF